jgi:SNF2 family DNA or RNA helicase
MYRRIKKSIVFVVDGHVCVSGPTRDHQLKYGIPDWLVTLLNRPMQPILAVQPPVTFCGTLRPYQCEALGFAHHRSRTMLALDCGLGKTLIGIAYMLSHLPAIVICPASLQASWHEHIALFAPSAVGQISVMSYNKMKDQVREGGLRTQCIVADEAHYLKHESSQRSKCFTKLLKRIPKTLLLTGTPAQRNVELFHLLKLLDPSHFKHFFHHGHRKVVNQLYFAERYSVPQQVWIGGAKHGFKFTKNQNGEELALICERYMLRMKKEKVVDLPTLTKSAVSLGTVEDPKYFEGKWKEIETIREVKGNRMADVELLALCRETAQRKIPLLTPWINDWIQSHPTEKLIVFYHHQIIGQQLFDLMDLPPVGKIRIDGKTTMKKRVEYIRSFRDDPSCRVGIFSMCATSTGLNLQFCTKIMFAELTFLSTHHSQAEARIHRIGQDRPVSVDYLLLDGTTDTLLWQSLLSKRRTECLLFDQKEEASEDGDEEEEIHPL